MQSIPTAHNLDAIVLFNLQSAKEEMLSRIGQTETTYQEISQKLRSILQPFNSSLQVDYFPAHSISPATIASMIKKTTRTRSLES
jgi:hypothetical protein